MGEITCPRCDMSLKDGQVVRAFRPPVCPRLHGLYLDKWHVTHQFHDDEQRTLRAARDAGRPGDLACPTCSAPMRALTVGPGIELDGCVTCGGYWFDFGELEALRKGGLQVEEAHEVPSGLRALVAKLSAALGLE